MNTNRLINMLTRMFVRSAVNTGIDLAARGGKSEAEMTPEERKQAKAMRGIAKNAQKAARMGRRFLR
jgi:hypothetical protein